MTTQPQAGQLVGRDLPKGVLANPRLSRWLHVHPDGRVDVAVGKVEYGQGIVTALAQMAADELDVDLADVAMIPASTEDGPDEGLTAGSMSVADSGAAVRQVCAEVRGLFVTEAAESLGTDPEAVVVRAGVLSDARGSGSTTYGQLSARVDLDRDADGSATPKAASALTVVGTSVGRLDLPGKIAGRPSFIHDLALPGQLYGRVVRPPSPAAHLLAADTAAARALAGVASVLHDGDFLGVVATDELVADSAARLLRERARWREEDTLPDEDDLPRFLRAAPADSFVVTESEDRSTPPPAAQRVSATYSRPFLAHASMAPSCGVARWDGAAVSVWSHSQGIHGLRTAIASALGLDGDRVSVRHVEGAGCYGHNGADDAAFDAVLLARTVPGRPVQVRWSRSDELTWSPFGSAMVADVAAEVGGSGEVLSWSYDVWSQGHVARPGYAGAPGLLAAAHLGRPQALPPPTDPPLRGGGGTARNAVPVYDFPRRSIHAHRVLRAPLRSSAMRSLGAFFNVFAIESFVDELAAAAGRDALDYRLAHLRDPRARDVLRAAASLGRWGRSGEEEGVGHGVGLARYKDSGAYCAVVADVEAVHEVRVRRLSIAVDVGRVVNPDGVRNQIEGGAVQATSWTLKERVRFDRRRVVSADWESYPILRFSEVPRVDVTLVSRPDEPSVGAGEAAQGPTAAAIGNALADALGVRVRDLPLTTERIVAVLDT